MKSVKNGSRVPAVEVLISTPLIRDYILHEEKTASIRDAIAAGTSQYGMQTFDQSLFYLYQSGMITLEEAFAVRPIRTNSVSGLPVSKTLGDGEGRNGKTRRRRRYQQLDIANVTLFDIDCLRQPCGLSFFCDASPLNVDCLRIFGRKP